MKKIFAAVLALTLLFALTAAAADCIACGNCETVCPKKAIVI